MAVKIIPARRGVAAGCGPGQGRAAGLPGLLVHISVQYTDGRREVFGSGADWTAGEAPYRQSGYRNDEGDPVEHLDGQATTTASGLARLSDGSVNVPKATQRRLAVRTAVSEVGEAAATLQLPAGVSLVGDPPLVQVSLRAPQPTPTPATAAMRCC